MSKRGSDFLYHWISDRLPDDPIIDPVLLVIDMTVDAKRAAEAEGISSKEIEEEIGAIGSKKVAGAPLGGCPNGAGRTEQVRRAFSDSRFLT